MRRIETLKEGTEAVGNRVRVKVVKNKVAAPFRQAEFDIEYGVGISHEGCLLDLALEHDLVQKSGSFFSYGELRLGQGRNNTKQYLAENPELAGEIEAKLFARARDRARRRRRRARSPTPRTPSRRRPPRAPSGGRGGRRARAQGRLDRAADRASRTRSSARSRRSRTASARAPSSPPGSTERGLRAGGGRGRRSSA